MTFPIRLTTTVLLIATTLVILGRLFQAHGKRQRTALLSTRHLTTNSLKGTNTSPPLIVGFLHPYCNAGGGGERVLFAAISYLQRSDPNVLSVVYTGDISPTVTKSEILRRCKERFGIELDATKIEFVQLKWRWLVEDSTWKRFTLAGQGLGAALLAVEALWRLVPDVFFDTHGLAFSYPIARFLTHGLTQQTTKPPMPIIAYIHYPTISASMLKRIESRSTTYANSSTITSSTWRSSAKTLYYRLFTFFYTSALRVIVPPTFIAVNSSWTKAHVEALLATRGAEGTLPVLGFMGALVDLGSMLVGWNLPTPEGINQPPKEGAITNAPASNVHTGVRRIYPPCDVDPLRAFPLEGRKKVVFSCAQFRPEKDHVKQIRAFAVLFNTHPELFVPERKVDTTTTTTTATRTTEIESGTKEPASVEQSGWLHVDSSRPPSPSKSKPFESSSITGSAAGDNDNSNGGENSKSGLTGRRREEDETLKLVLLGSARHQEDLARVEELKSLVRELGIEPHVEFRLNAPYDELLHWLSISSIGISTMVEEHFGIGVVEFMGAGLIPVVHASGGPIMDIVTPIDQKPTGYLATSAEEFAEQLYTALQMEEQDVLEMRARARESSARFSTAAFENGFGAMWEDVKKTL